jgi:hypothetical protein
VLSALWSRLICSNSSTRDRATPGPPRRRHRRKNPTQDGAKIRDDTPTPPNSGITTQAEPKFATKTWPTGATSGDHTQQYALYAAVAFIRAAVERVGVSVRQVCRELAQRDSPQPG